MIKFLVLVSRQGKVRLEKCYASLPVTNRPLLIRNITQSILIRPLGASHVVEGRDFKLVYKRYASLYFVVGVDDDDNELLILEFIHHFVEALDRYFGNVCELDLIFNFHKVHMILDELIMDGRYLEPSKKSALRIIAAQDVIIEDSINQNAGILSATDFNKRQLHSL